MASNVPATTIRIDPEVKREAAAVLDELGLSMSGAMNIFLRAVIREGGLPFDVRLGSAGKADGEGGDRDGRGWPDYFPLRRTADRVKFGLTEPFLIPVPEKSLCIESHNYHFVNISMKLTP